MLNSKKSKFKKIICCSVLCLGITVSALAGLFYHKSENVYASTSSYVTEDVSASLLGTTAYNFNTTSTSKPATPSNWSEATGGKNTENIKKGIVNLENDTTFDSDIYKTSRPTTLPKAVTTDKSYYKSLMINSYNGSGRLGYKSSSFTLESNSFYSISINLYTHRTSETDEDGNLKVTDPRASVYLTGLVDEENTSFITKFENINTLQAWDTYTFYIDTNESKSINIELWLGSKKTSTEGAVFYNEVKIHRYSEDYYYEEIINSDLSSKDGKYSIISLSEEYDTPVTNSSFESTSGWTKFKTSSTNSNEVNFEYRNVNNSIEVKDKTIQAPGSNNSVNNTTALFIHNIESGYQALESSEITINQHSYYKLSFWAKSDCNVGSGATVKLVDKDEENPIASASLTLATKISSGNNKFRNDWTQYTFYIYGPATKSATATIQIWLGTEDSPTNGYVFIDDFRIQEISYSVFNSNSKSSNSTSFNFNNAEDKYTIENGNFDKTSNEDNSVTYPLAPTGWEYKSSSKSNTYSGVINTNETHFNNNINNYYDNTNSTRQPIRPGKLPYVNESADNNNNVLMIGNASENNTQKFVSSDINFDAHNYYKLSFYALTDYDNYDSNNNLGARVRLVTEKRTLFDLYNICDIFNDNNWHKYEVYFKTGHNSEAGNIELMFDNLNGYVFFDEIHIETSTEAAYNSFTQSSNNKYYKIDLSQENFDNRTFNINQSVQTPNNWICTNTEDDYIDKGIIQISTLDIENANATPSGNKNVLYISSLHDTTTQYNSKETIVFNAGTYYKVTLNILTTNIDAEVKNDAETQPGAYLALTDSTDIKLSGINTNGLWKPYTFYLNLAETLTSGITLGLGNSEQNAKGTVLFDNLVVTEINEETYTTEFGMADDNTTKAFINYKEPETTEEESEESGWNNDIDWLILPSLITAFAIIIAVVGFYIRKFKFNRKPKIKTKYDRRKTLDRDISKREKIALRKQIIDELNLELESIDKEIEEYSKLADEQLQKLRDQIIDEQEQIKRQKLEIEIRKKEATAEREKQLKENPELVSNSKAEKEFTSFITKLDRQEMSLQKQLNAKDVKLANASEADKSKLSKFLERKEFIKNEIAKIENEIEEIAREEEDMWEEYKLAKAEAKKKKEDYKEQVKYQKEQSKKSSTQTTKKSNTSKKEKSDKK